MKPEVAELVHHWTGRADGHLISATALLECGKDGVWDAVCYHAHEAVAIYLKALQTMNNIPAPRTHDLEYLHRMLPESCRLEVDAGDLACLSTYGIERWWEPDPDQAKRAIHIATAARRSLRAVLLRAGIAPREL